LTVARDAFGFRLRGEHSEAAARLVRIGQRREVLLRRRDRAGVVLELASGEHLLENGVGDGLRDLGATS
jgi:hypothetical protein